MKSGLNVCIDCSPLLVRSAGVKTYIYQWVRALRECEPESITTFLEPRHRNLDHTAAIARNLSGLAALWTLNHLGPRTPARFFPACSVFHQSNLLRRRMPAARLSATINDLTPWIVPDCHTSRQKAADEDFANNVLKSADGLICISENSRQDAERILRLDPRKMTVIWPGVAEAYFHAGHPQADAAAEALGIQGPYFLFVSTIEPRKNVDGLLDSWLSLSSDIRNRYQLVVAGMPGWMAEAALRRLRQLTADSSGVRYLGYVDEAWMPGLTAGARALVYPSFYEGFGLPVAQAFAAGCPVIASGVSCLPEVIGEAGLLVDPRSVTELANAIRQAGESDSLCDRLLRAGRERARLFSWQRAARQSLDFFRALAA